ncbi:hypothetical protein ACFV2N_31725, partial [Streptomyces sp. NPDC059680]|uniref:hypothetical protein n=1 Tax=Streptomyces sp. NPDC059680 TaxID=3346904 RepID=UPI0036AA63DB
VTGTITDPHTTNNTSSAKTKLLGVTPAQADLPPFFTVVPQLVGPSVVAEASVVTLSWLTAMTRM